MPTNPEVVLFKWLFGLAAVAYLLNVVWQAVSDAPDSDSGDS